MLRFMSILVLTIALTSGDTEVNITSGDKSENLTSEEIYIRPSEEEKDDEELPFEVILERAKEFDDISTTTPDIPYLPLIQRCSIDADCSSETACFDGKCLNASRSQPFPFFQRCQSRLDCPSGHRCFIRMCIPFRW